MPLAKLENTSVIISLSQRPVAFPQGRYLSGRFGKGVGKAGNYYIPMTNQSLVEMDKIVYKLVFNRKKDLNRQGMALVQVEAYLMRRKKYFSTHVYLRPKQWDARRQRVKLHPNADGLNRWLHGQLAEMERQELALRQQGKTVSLDLLKSALKERDGRQSFLRFFRQEAERAPLKPSTRRNLLSTLALLEAFRPDIGFTDITFGLVADFDHFLRTKGLHPNTVAKHMRHLKRQVNLAMDKGLADPGTDVFRKYRIRTVESHHSHLTPDELCLLEGLQLDGRYLRWQHTLDAFLFCCYAGLRYSDFCSLSAANVVLVRKQPWLVYRSVKTDTEVRLPLHLLFGGKALRILHKYAEKPDDFFRLPHNSNVNKQLLGLARLAGLEKRISFHTARHTNATLLVYQGVNLTTVQRLLGHRSIRTTQLYANVMDMTLVHDLERLAPLEKCTASIGKLPEVR